MAKKKVYYTTDPTTGAIIMGHIYKNEIGERIEIANTDVNAPDMSKAGFTHVYSAYATPKAAQNYIRIQEAAAYIWSDSMECMIAKGFFFKKHHYTWNEADMLYYRDDVDDAWFEEIPEGAVIGKEDICHI